MVSDEHVEQKNSTKIGSKTHLFLKQRWQGFNKLNSFENLIGQSSHMPVLSSMPTNFEFVPCKNKSCIWSCSCDMVTDIYSKPLKALTWLLSVWWLSLLHACIASDISPCTDRDNSQHGRTYSQQNHVYYHHEIGIFATLQNSKLCMDVKITSHIQIRMFS